ncbi:MAG: hypothetical protein AAB036_02795 [Elusimicrobiota bacterium]
MFRLLIAIALCPLSGALLWVSAKTLAGVTLSSSSSSAFIAGVGIVFASWVILRYLIVEPIRPVVWMGRIARWSYVLGHEMTHALATWATGGSVYAISVGEEDGHVDLSHSNAFVALAPYCVPFYALFVVVAYRLLLWMKPEIGGEALFLLLMGAALSAHLLFTWDALTQVRQPDLDAAGGVVFSWVWIAAANALMIMLVLKGLFPESVSLLLRLREAVMLAAGFWSRVWLWSRPMMESAWRRALA